LRRRRGFLAAFLLSVGNIYVPVCVGWLLLSPPYPPLLPILSHSCIFTSNSKDFFSFAFHWILEVRLLIRLLLLCPIFVSLLPLLFSSSVLIISMTPSLFLIFFFLLWH
jgi:hypothetical protein